MAGTGEQPGVDRISPDGRSLVVTNRGSNSVSVFDVTPYDPAATSEPPPQLPSCLSRVSRGFGCCDFAGFLEGFYRLLWRVIR